MYSIYYGTAISFRITLRFIVVYKIKTISKLSPLDKVQRNSF